MHRRLIHGGLLKKDEYDNLILLCSAYHKEIDDNPEKYTVSLLHSLKGYPDYRVEIGKLITSYLSLQRDIKLENDFIFQSRILLFAHKYSTIISGGDLIGPT